MLHEFLVHRLKVKINCWEGSTVGTSGNNGLVEIAKSTWHANVIICLCPFQSENSAGISLTIAQKLDNIIMSTRLPFEILEKHKIISRNCNVGLVF